MSTQVTVDRIRCDGRGVCAELFPEFIALDDWGYPLVAAGDVPTQLMPLARLAVSSCPVMALRLAATATARPGDSPRLTGVSQQGVTVL